MMMFTHETCEVRYMKQYTYHFISEALKGVNSEARDPVFAKYHAGTELLSGFSYMGVRQSPWGCKCPAFDPATKLHKVWRR